MSSEKIESLITEALEILASFGVPMDGLTPRRKQKMAKAFIAVAGLRPGMSWAHAIANEPKHRPTSRDVIKWMNTYLGESIADSSYDDIRRKDLIFPVEAGIVLKAAGNENTATNDGTRGYAINPVFLPQIHKYGTPEWKISLLEFMKGKITLIDELKSKRELAMLPVKIGDSHVVFSPGEHNQIQKDIIEQFLPRFGFDAEVLYVGDTIDKYLFLDRKKLIELKFFDIAHGKLPDVLAFSKGKNWIYLIEAVHSANPIDEMRKRTLEQLTKNCSVEIVYVTAFLNRASFKKFASDIAWETEVWIADNPEHLIHYNGDKFLGPHTSTIDK